MRHRAFSHKDIGWQEFTDAAIRVLAGQDRPLVFILWGKAGTAEGIHDHQSQTFDSGKARIPVLFRLIEAFSGADLFPKQMLIWRQTD